jgi:hypothetical protein
MYDLDPSSPQNSHEVGVARTLLYGRRPFKEPTMNRLALFAAAAVSLSSLVGCQADEPATGSDESNQTSSSSCAYSGEGNALYKEAVELAKRYQGSVCEVLQYEVVSKAQAAVDVCPAVGNLIATSQWAGALRETLGPLQVADYAGVIESKKGGFDLTEVGVAFDAGQTFWSPSIGAYGNWIIMHFAAGAYETETLVVEGEQQDIVRKVTDTGSYSFYTAEDGRAVMRIESSSQPVRELVLERYVTEYDPVDMFRLSPIGGSTDPDNRSDQLFNVNIGECDA